MRNNSNNSKSGKASHSTKRRLQRLEQTLQGLTDESARYNLANAQAQQVQSADR
ncbi:hypothetical protein OK016_25880 [Vibrio chagasii]|nr:hypothetical protein [Vibrio chagasii]